MKKVSNKKAETKTYGLHLMLDGYGGNNSRLADVNLLYRTLSDLPAKIGMHRVGFPHVIQFLEGDIAGISGFVFIMESHISVHTYSNKGFLSMDVYSCKAFDHRKVVREIKKIYRLKGADVYVQERGRKFPA